MVVLLVLLVLRWSAASERAPRARKRIRRRKGGE